MLMERLIRFDNEFLRQHAQQSTGLLRTRSKFPNECISEQLIITLQVLGLNLEWSDGLTIGLLSGGRGGRGG